MDASRPNSDGTPGARNFDNPAITAGFTYLGQFLDHDMTFDPTSSLARRQDPESIRNFRIPGSAAASINGKARFDLPRNSQSTALAGDTRNENLIVAQLHLAGVVVALPLPRL